MNMHLFDRELPHGIPRGVDCNLPACQMRRRHWTVIGSWRERAQFGGHAIVKVSLSFIHYVSPLTTSLDNSALVTTG